MCVCASEIAAHLITAFVTGNVSVCVCVGGGKRGEQQKRSSSKVINTLRCRRRLGAPNNSNKRQQQRRIALRRRLTQSNQKLPSPNARFVSSSLSASCFKSNSRQKGTTTTTTTATRTHRQRSIPPWVILPHWSRQNETKRNVRVAATALELHFFGINQQRRQQWQREPKQRDSDDAANDALLLVFLFVSDSWLNQFDSRRAATQQQQRQRRRTVCVRRREEAAAATRRDATGRSQWRHGRRRHIHSLFDSQTSNDGIRMNRKRHDGSEKEKQKQQPKQRCDCDACSLQYNNSSTTRDIQLFKSKRHLKRVIKIIKD